MSSEEQKQILKMVEEGKISAEEAMKLIEALGESSDEAEVIEGSSPELGEATSAFGSGTTAGFESASIDPDEFDEVAYRARSLWRIPLWIGVAIIALTAFWLDALVSASNFGFWFYCAWVPLLFGVLLVGLFAGSRTSRWLYVNVEQRRGEWPRNITLGFPLPLGLTAWFLRHFGHNIGGLRHTNVDEVVEILSAGLSSREPMIVNVNEGEGGERVQVYIG